MEQYEIALEDFTNIKLNTKSEFDEMRGIFPNAPEVGENGEHKLCLTKDDLLHTLPELKKKSKLVARVWVYAGLPCRKQFGFSWKGAGSREITNKQAKDLLPGYSFGMGFYELRFENGSLIFNNYSENDML